MFCLPKALGLHNLSSAMVWFCGLHIVSFGLVWKAGAYLILLWALNSWEVIRELGHMPPWGYLFNILLSSLVVMHLYWFTLILKVAIQQLKSGKAEDIREEKPHDKWCYRYSVMQFCCTGCRGRVLKAPRGEYVCGIRIEKWSEIGMVIGNHSRLDFLNYPLRLSVSATASSCQCRDWEPIVSPCWTPWPVPNMGPIVSVQRLVQLHLLAIFISSPSGSKFTEVVFLEFGVVAVKPGHIGFRAREKHIVSVRYGWPELYSGDLWLNWENRHMWWWQVARLGQSEKKFVTLLRGKVAARHAARWRT